METVLVAGSEDPLVAKGPACAGGLPAPRPGRLEAGVLEIDETLPERLRQSLAALSPADRPSRIVLAPAAGVDPFGADQFLQSVTFLTASAALEADVGVSLITRGVPARGFSPLFSRTPLRVAAQVAVTLPAFEPAGAAPWSARVHGIRLLAEAGVRPWLRLDPAIPGRTDAADILGPWFEMAAQAGAAGVVVAPLVLDEANLDRLADDPVPLGYYRPGRRPRRGQPVPPPEVHLPLEREAAFLWRVRQLAEDLGLVARLCRCARRVEGSCGLVPPVRRPAGTPRRQLALWAG